MQQVSTLIYCMGKEATGIPTSFRITDIQRKDYDVVIKRNSSRCDATSFITVPRFNKQSLREGEISEQYIMEVGTLVENGNHRDEMIRDDLV